LPEAPELADQQYLARHTTATTIRTIVPEAKKSVVLIASTGVTCEPFPRNRSRLTAPPFGPPPPSPLAKALKIRRASVYRVLKRYLKQPDGTPHIRCLSFAPQQLNRPNNQRDNDDDFNCDNDSFHLRALQSL
jgi:hypothetical protein